MNVKNLLIDKEKAEAGEWFQYGEDGPKFLLASVHAKAHKDELQKLMKQHRGEVGKPGIMERITDLSFAKKCLLSWEGLSAGEPGEEKPFPPTLDNKLFVLTGAPDLKAWLNEKAATLENYQSAEAEAEDAEALKSGPEVDAGASGGGAGVSGVTGRADPENSAG